MHTPLFIARRYFFSRTSQHIVTIISAVSVVGILLSTAALVIVLSAFNGIEQFVIQLFSAFESDIRVTSTNNRLFDEDRIPSEVYALDGLTDYTKVIEETVIVRNGEKLVIGTLKGVQPSFLSMSAMGDHLLDGSATITVDGRPAGLIGSGLLEQLGAYIYTDDFSPERLTIYTPNRKQKINRRTISNAFTTAYIPVVGTFSFNRDIDQKMLIVPLPYAAQLVDSKRQLTAVECTFAPGTDLEQKKAQLQALLGDRFQVKTNSERNALIYQTGKSEKWMTLLLLAFITLLATFNMIAAITMLMIEKKANIQTLFSLGIPWQQLQRIFLYVGLLINATGGGLGLIVGYGTCLLQRHVGLIRMNEGIVEYFPIAFKGSDLCVILAILLIFGWTAAYIPSRLSMRRMLPE